jgi:hypothetical protein
MSKEIGRKVWYTEVYDLYINPYCRAGESKTAEFGNKEKSRARTLSGVGALSRKLTSV